MRSIVAGLLGLVVPGVGHAYIGRRRLALLFAVPVVLLAAAWVLLFLLSGRTSLIGFLLTPGVLPALAVVNVALAAWRIAAGVDAARRVRPSRAAIGVLSVATLALVLAPQLLLGSVIVSANDFLDSMFASADGSTAPEPASSDMPTNSDGGFIVPEDLRDGWEGGDVPSAAEPTPTPNAVPVARGPMGPGVGTLPSLGAAVPWARAGEIPWGSDGRFDLLLLGSDAGIDRWSRRMDVMLLIEVDVATGKVAMIGLPRNLINAPFPPGPARDAVKCGCLTGLLNEMYVEATVRNPARWPGTGAVKGIGAVRSMIMELTGRPVDGVVVADLWGVIKVVDALGGIDINVPAPVYDARYPDPVYGNIVLRIPAGQQHLDGRMALAYARSRHQDSDYGRMARQQTLLLAMRRQIGPATILNATALFDAARGFAWTDLPREALPALGDLFDRAARASVVQLRIVPRTYSTILTPGEVTRIRADIAALLGVAPPPTPSPTPTASTVPTAVPTDAPIPTPSPTPAPSAAGSPSASP
ncbi:MAG: LCP family protein [Chloroflexi bacterium]|nr:LCP family protein [Chloroflexota bacterium]